MSDENNFPPPSNPAEPPKNDPPADSPTPAEPKFENFASPAPETVRVKIEPEIQNPEPVESIPEPEVEKAAPVESESVPTEPEVAPVEPEVSAEPQVEKFEPEVEKIESTPEPVEPTPAPAEPVEDSNFVAPTPEPEIEKVESEVVSEEPAEPEIQNPAPVEPEIAQSAIIAGAPSRPGDKVEKEIPAADSKKEEKLKTGFRPDGVISLDGEEKMFAAIGYISFLCFLPLLTRRDSQFAQHHARQATVIFVGFVFLWMIAALSGTLRVLVLLLNLIAIVGGFALAYKGDWFRIPGIYDLSLKLKQTPPPPPARSAPPSGQNSVNENEIGEDDGDE
jgi:uncharacterized membrane protein